jgi:hypothetical protein
MLYITINSDRPSRAEGRPRRPINPRPLGPISASRSTRAILIAVPPSSRPHTTLRVIVSDSSLKTELPGVLKGVNLGASRGKAVLLYANWSIKEC